MTRAIAGAFWVVIAAGAVLLFVRSGSIPLMDPDEARFARTSIEMMRGQDLVVPMFEGRPRLVKPPLLHWIQSSLFAVLGDSSWTARLHAGLAGIGSLLLVGWLARKRFGDEAACWAAAFLGTMPLFFVAGRLGTLDALLAVHVLAVVALDMAEPEASEGTRGLAVGGLLGLGFLVKGPVAVALPLLIALAGRTASARDLLPSWGALLQGVAGWCAVVLPWGIALIRRMGWDEVGETLRGEAFERYFAGTTHVEPFWFYGAVVFAGFLPWIGPLVLALVRVVRLGRDPAARTALYAAAGFVAGLIFFSIGKSKLPTYILPLAPLAAILVAWELGQELQSKRQRTAGSTTLVLSIALCAVLFGTAGVLLDVVSHRATAFAGAAVYTAAALVALPGLLRHRPRWVYGCNAVASAVFLVVIATVLHPDHARGRSTAPLIEAVPALRSERPVIVVDMKVPSMTYYLDRAPESVDMAVFEERLARDDDPLIVFDRSDLPAAPQAALAGLEEIGQQGKYIVYRKR